MKIQINGESREMPDGSSLRDVVDTLGLAAERVAIELNQHVVRRVEWANTELRDGDRVEIVHFVGGGG